MRPIERIGEFLVSPSGSVEPGGTAGVGWLAIAIGALAAVLGTSGQASADDCYGVPLFSCNYRCQNDPECQYSVPAFERWNFVCHYPEEQGGCTVTQGECGCP